MQEIAAYITAYWTGGTSNGTITYKYHHHDSSCYDGCSGKWYVTGFDTCDDGWCDWHLKCNVCGATKTCHHQADSASWLNGMSHGTKKCSYEEGQLIGAEITY